MFAFQGAGSIFRTYNLILDRAAPIDDLEAMTLVHQDVEIVDADLCQKLRGALRDPQVAVVGCVGVRGAESIAWWDGQVTWTPSLHRYGELGGGELSSGFWNNGEPSSRTREVDTVLGFVLALSAWTVGNIRFDESLGLLDGYDFDVCQQVRTARRKVVTADLKVAHHHSLDLVTEPVAWSAAHMRVAEKWDGALQGPGPAGNDWKRRARRAEAEAAAARLLVSSKQLQRCALDQEHEEALRRITDSASWRVTAPLRRLNALRKARSR